jgi:hypothetical protein
MFIGRLVKLALLVGVLAVVGLLLFRPATLFGVNGKALANSLGSEVRHSQANCVQSRTGGWRCALDNEEVAGVEYLLSTHSYGCWSGRLVADPRTAAPVERTVSGCIGLADEFGH